MKYTMYIKGSPVGRWALCKNGSYFKPRVWRNRERVKAWALECYFAYGDVFIEVWEGNVGENCIERIEYNDKYSASGE